MLGHPTVGMTLDLYSHGALDMQETAVRAMEAVRPGWVPPATLTPMAIAFQHLVKKPNGDAEIAGTGIRVCTLHALYEMGDTPERIADGYSLPLAAVLDALAYAADNPDEIEATNRADEEAGESVIVGMPEPLRSHVRQTVQADKREYEELVRRVKEARRGAAVP